MKSKQNHKGLSKITAQKSTSRKTIIIIFIFIIAISFWIYNYYIYDEDKAIIFKLYPRYKNASFEDISIHEIKHKYYHRTLLTEKPPIWTVKSFYDVFYIELNIAGKPYHMIIDSGSSLSWVNCKINDNIGPSPDYLVKHSLSL